MTRRPSCPPRRRCSAAPPSSSLRTACPTSPSCTSARAPSSRSPTRARGCTVQHRSTACLARCGRAPSTSTRPCRMDRPSRALRCSTPSGRSGRARRRRCSRARSAWAARRRASSAPRSTTRARCSPCSSCRPREGWQTEGWQTVRRQPPFRLGAGARSRRCAARRKSSAPEARALDRSGLCALNASRTDSFPAALGSAETASPLPGSAPSSLSPVKSRNPSLSKPRGWDSVKSQNPTQSVRAVSHVSRTHTSSSVSPTHSRTAAESAEGNRAPPPARAVGGGVCAASSRYLASSRAVDGSAQRGGSPLERAARICARTSCASSLPSSTPHWSKELTPHTKPCTAVRCS
mmetsp:Transcript_7361/g.23239  ORF Transcript_7361/g.23239 Transcript_7361/m.23239 type:complete len:349 (+) Transcript_7361:76-1122(+)